MAVQELRPRAWLPEPLPLGGKAFGAGATAAGACSSCFSLAVAPFAEVV